MFFFSMQFSEADPPTVSTQVQSGFTQANGMVTNLQRLQITPITDQSCGAFPFYITEWTETGSVSLGTLSQLHGNHWHHGYNERHGNQR